VARRTTLAGEQSGRGEAEMAEDDESGLTAEETRELQLLAGLMVPASAEFGVPGADDPAIFADIVRSLGRDRDAVKAALARLRSTNGRPLGALAPGARQPAAIAFLDEGGAQVVALGRAVLQCYYRDDRVMRSIGREPRAPFPKGHQLEPGDWSLLDAVRGRPRMWRDVDGNGG
jgi:hypothetical protein